MNNNSSNYATAFEASLHQNGSGGGGTGDTSTTSQFSTPNFPVMSKIFPQHNLPETSSMTTSTSIPTTTSTDLTRIGKQNICKNTRISRWVEGFDEFAPVLRLFELKRLTSKPTFWSLSIKKLDSIGNSLSTNRYYNQYIFKAYTYSYTAISLHSPYIPLKSLRPS